MKAFVLFPSNEGACRVELDIMEGSEFTLAHKYDGEVTYELGTPIIRVKDTDTAERIMMEPRDLVQTHAVMSIASVNNIISLVAMTVDELRRGESLPTMDAMEHHLRINELYESLPQEVKDHAIAVVCAINGHLAEED